MPRSQYHPTPAERDERVKLDLPADKAIKLVMETGPNPEDDERDQFMESLVAMVEATGAILTGEFSARFWIVLLAAYDVVFTIASLFLFGFVLQAE